MKWRATWSQEIARRPLKPMSLSIRFLVHKIVRPSVGYILFLLLMTWVSHVVWWWVMNFTFTLFSKSMWSGEQLGVRKLLADRQNQWVSLRPFSCSQNRSSVCRLNSLPASNDMSFACVWVEESRMLIHRIFPYIYSVQSGVFWWQYSVQSTNKT